MTFNKYTPYILISITDDNAVVRNNLSGTSFPFPLDVRSFEIKKSVNTNTSSPTGQAKISINSPLTSGTFNLITTQNSVGAGGIGGQSFGNTGSFNQIPIGKYEGYFTNLNNKTTIEIGIGSPGSVMFSGFIGGWNKQFREFNPSIDFLVRDLTHQLQNAFLQNLQTFTSGTDYGQVVRTLLSNMDTRVSFTNSTVPLTGQGLISDRNFFRQPLMGVLNTLASEVNMDYWVDINGNLNFRKRGFNTTTTTLNSATSPSQITANKDIQDTINVVYVNGGKVQSQPITVTNEPRTYLTATQPQVYFLGHAYIGSVMAVSGTLGGGNFVFQQPRDYTLTSGGNSIQWTSNGSKPDNNTTFNTTYQYNELGRAIFASATDTSSIAKYGVVRTQWIVRSDIAQNASGATLEAKYQAGSAQAAILAQGYLRDNSVPRETILWKADEWIPVDLGDRVSVTIPEFGISNVSYRITDIGLFYDKSRPITTELTMKILIGDTY